MKRNSKEPFMRLRVPRRPGIYLLCQLRRLLNWALNLVSDFITAAKLEEQKESMVTISITANSATMLEHTLRQLTAGPWMENYHVFARCADAELGPSGCFTVLDGAFPNFRQSVRIGRFLCQAENVPVELTFTKAQKSTFPERSRTNGVRKRTFIQRCMEDVE